jgi:steroid 5-alpha reductase family enzyme
MTTRTGITEQTLAGTVDPPPYWLAMVGSTIQMGVLLWIWSDHHASAGKLFTLNDLSKDPFTASVAATLGLIFTTWIISVVDRSPHGGPNPSLVDRMWSILPAVYCWWWYIKSEVDENTSPRLLVMTLLVTAWACRLTYNFFIKGGFSGGEDYRWKEVRSWFPGARFEIFNLVFICFFQLLLILAFTVPAVTALEHPEVPFGPIDITCMLLFLILLVGEGVADRQMFAFQTEKYRRLKAGETAGPIYSAGFIQSGLWAYSRHPNYFCEVHLWWAFYGFSVAATGHVLNWSICGAAFLTLLFVPPGGSIDVTEALSSRKYPAYAAYQKRVSCFFPWPMQLQQKSS